MAENTVIIQAVTHLIVNPRQELNVDLLVRATFECSWWVQISDEEGLVRHEIRLPLLPRDTAWSFKNYLAPLHTIEVYASPLGKALEDFVSLQVNETATRLALATIDNEYEQIDFQVRIDDPPPLTRQKK